MKSSTRFTLIAFTVALALAPALVPSLAQTPTTTPQAASLYDRLGGLYPVAALVDDFINRVYVNDTINANPNIAKVRSEIRKPGLKVQVTNQVCMVTGGLAKYTGKNMKEAHAGFQITQKEWDALMVDFRASLDKFKVPSHEQQELIGIVESTKPDIVAGAVPAK